MPSTWNYYEVHTGDAAAALRMMASLFPQLVFLGWINAMIPISISKPESGQTKEGRFVDEDI